MDDPLIATLDLARRWVAAIDWSDWHAALRDLERTNAFTEPGAAERSGLPLVLPEH